MVNLTKFWDYGCWTLNFTKKFLEDNNYKSQELFHSDLLAPDDQVKFNLKKIIPILLSYSMPTKIQQWAIYSFPVWLNVVSQFNIWHIFCGGQSGWSIKKSLPSLVSMILVYYYLNTLLLPLLRSANDGKWFELYIHGSSDNKETLKPPSLYFAYLKPI